MAGAGVTVFTAGSPLTATQVNTYLMDQVVAYFADSAARDAAFGGAGEPSLSAGRLAYLFSDNKLYLYDNTNNWVEIGAQIEDGEVTSAKIADGTIVNADINASAAIADTKLATIATAGKVSNSATTATDANTASAIVARDASGNFIAGTATLSGASVSGRFDGTAVREAVIDASVSASVVTADYSTGDIFYVGTAPASNFTVNLTNAPTDNGKTITVVIFVTQGATGYIPNAVQVAGSAQTIKWANGAAPIPTSSAGKIDIFSFTFVRRSSAWTVFGSSNLGY